MLNVDLTMVAHNEKQMNALNWTRSDSLRQRASTSRVRLLVEDVSRSLEDGLHECAKQQPGNSS
jgi:hypothetical protein